MSWFTESNRWKHFVLGIPAGLILTILFAAGCATGMEFKDKQWGGKWDWIDWGCTVAGGLIGQGLQILIIYLILTLFNMDTASCIALIVFGVIVLTFWLLGQFKFGWFPKIDFKNFFSLENLKFLPFHLLLGGMGIVPIVIGVVSLLK